MLALSSVFSTAAVDVTMTLQDSAAAYQSFSTQSREHESVYALDATAVVLAIRSSVGDGVSVLSNDEIDVTSDQEQLIDRTSVRLVDCTTL